MTMQTVLSSLEAWLKANYRAAHGSLQPGLSDKQIDALLNDWPFKLSADVRALYRWHDGLEDTQVQLLPGLSFLPLAQSLELAGALWELSAAQVKKGGADFFPPALLPIFSDDANDVLLMVQGFETAEATAPAQVAALQQGQRLYAFTRLEDLLKAALTLLESGGYAVDQERDLVSIVDEAAARAVWRRYPLLYLEETTPEVMEEAGDDADTDDAELDDPDLDDEAAGETMLLNLMSMLGLNPDEMDPETATLDELQDLQEISPVHEWPEALQARFHALGGVVTLDDPGPESQSSEPTR